MTTPFPAFESALASGDQDALRSLYTLAMAQRDRAEAQIRALLSQTHSTQAIGAAQAALREPKGCPTPGACSCEQAEYAPSPTQWYDGLKPIPTPASAHVPRAKPAAPKPSRAAPAALAPLDLDAI